MTDSNELQNAQPCNRIIYLGSSIDDEACGKVMAGLFSLDLSYNAPIHIIINSPGGVVGQLFAIYDVIKACSSPIWTFGVGQIMSAAVPLLASGEKGQRRISMRSRLMLHVVSGAVSGELNFLRNSMSEIERIQTAMEEILLEETKINKKTLSKFMDGEEHYISPKEAIKLGIADSLIK